MDRLSCNVIYVNRVVGEDMLLRATPDDSEPAQDSNPSDWKRDHAKELVQPLLDTFGDGKLQSRLNFILLFHLACGNSWFLFSFVLFFFVTFSFFISSAAATTSCMTLSDQMLT